jgi:hypothetical protein
MATDNPTGGSDAVRLKLRSHHANFLRGALETCKEGVEGDLANDPPHPDRRRAERQAVVYARLLAALDTGSIVPDPDVIAVVTALAEQTDASNDYEQVTLEHRAYCSLLTQLDEERAQ